MEVFKKLSLLVLFLFVSTNIYSQSDLELLEGLLDGGQLNNLADRRGLDPEDFPLDSLTITQLKNTADQVEEIDNETDFQLYQKKLYEERLSLATKLCDQDQRACFLIDEYRDYRESKVIESIDDLKVFGIDFFSGYPTSFDQSKSISPPESYTVKTGDIINISTVGGIRIFGDFRIERNGVLLIEGVESIPIAGMPFSKAKQAIKTSINDKYPGTEVAITLAYLNSMQVFVLGMVNNPGAYDIGAMSKTINALVASGGLSDESSLRNIRVLNNGVVKKEVDLYQFLVFGDTSSDIFLQDQDTLLISAVKDQVAIIGEVVRPAKYEILKGNTLKDLIKFAGGLKTDANQSNIILERRDANNNSYLSSKNINDNFELQNGDVIYINKIDGNLSDGFEIRGEIKNKGFYEISKKSSLANFITKKDILDDTYMPFFLIERFESKTRSSYFESYDLLSTNLENIDIFPKDIVYFFSKQDIKLLSSNLIFSYLISNNDNLDEQRDPSQIENSECLRGINTFASDDFKSSLIVKLSVLNQKIINPAPLF